MIKIIEGLWNQVSKNLEALTAEESESQKALRKVRNALKVPQLSAEPMLNQASQTGKMSSSHLDRGGTRRETRGGALGVGGELLRLGLNGAISAVKFEMIPYAEEDLKIYGANWIAFYTSLGFVQAGRTEPMWIYQRKEH